MNRIIAVASCALVLSIGSLKGQSVEEWKHDDGVAYEPFAFSPNDTLAVVFEGRSGIILDSIRVAFKDAGTATIGVWRHSGAVRPSPFANVLYVPSPLTVLPSDTNHLPATESTLRWKTLNLSSMALDGGTSFVVGVIMGVNPAVPGVLTAKINTGGLPDYSYTFFNANPSPQWTYPTEASGVVWQFLIRAYGHAGVTSVHDVDPVRAVSFDLLTTYPNPFNPTTTIRFAIRQQSRVRLAIYSVHGKLVSDVIDEEMAPGTYEQKWNARGDHGSSLASGLYVVRLASGDGVRSTKVLLLH